MGLHPSLFCLKSGLKLLQCPATLDELGSMIRKAHEQIISPPPSPPGGQHNEMFLLFYDFGINCTIPTSLLAALTAIDSCRFVSLT